MLTSHFANLIAALATDSAEGAIDTLGKDIEIALFQPRLKKERAFRSVSSLSQPGSIAQRRLQGHLEHIVNQGK